MGSDCGGGAHSLPGGSHDFVSLAKGIEYDSNEDIDAALQLSFEESPDSREREVPSPSKKARTPASDGPRRLPPPQHPTKLADARACRGSHPPQPPVVVGVVRPDSGRYTPQEQQHQQQQEQQQELHQPLQYSYNPAYYPGQSGWGASQTYQYPPSTSPQVAPPGYFPPEQQGHAAHVGQHPHSGGPQHPGHYQPTQQQHRHPHYHEQAQRRLPPLETPTGLQAAASPAGPRTPASKRKGPGGVEAGAGGPSPGGRPDADDGGPLSPPSGKKKRDAAAEAWGSPSGGEYGGVSPPRDYLVRPTVRLLISSMLFLSSAVSPRSLSAPDACPFFSQDHQSTAQDYAMSPMVSLTVESFGTIFYIDIIPYCFDAHRIRKPRPKEAL